MNVSLTPELEKFIAQKVSTGRYQSASEVVREALRILEERDRRKPSFMVSSMEELREKVQEGLDALDKGDYTEIKGEAELREYFDSIKAKGRERLAKAAQKPS